MSSYPAAELPGFLQGVVTPSKYRKWLTHRAADLRCRDIQYKRPFAAGATTHDYALAIQAAVLAHGQTDPYTGQPLRWDLIGTWDSRKKKAALSQPGVRAEPGDLGDFNKELYLMPTIDHKDPEAEVLDLEICSLRINCCKGSLNPDEFVELCKQVVEFRVKNVEKKSKTKRQRFSARPA